MLFLRPSSSFIRHFSTNKIPILDKITQLEKQNARILRIVQKRIQERDNIKSKLTPELSTPLDIARLRQLKESEPLQTAWTTYSDTQSQLEEAIPLLSDTDPSMRALADDEITELSTTLDSLLTQTFPTLLIPPSTTSHLSALMELKSGVGGSEASLFLADMLRMYQRLANTSNWSSDIVAKNDAEGGGIKDAIVEFKGQGAYDALKYESGVHRVQRVPATEASGRTHTSTIALVVLPLEEENAPQAEELFKMEDIKLEVMRARGAGGQHVNKTESAVRLTHVPTGITVSMQDERSQHQNRRRAFQVLRSRLLDLKITREIMERRDTRRNLVKTADRSEKIRTYNYAQDRVTDHRMGLTMKNLTSVMEGEGLMLFIDAMKKSEEERALEDMLAEAEEK